MSVLYIVPTPIGNLGDITVRSLETLKTVDFIAAEDTRVTQKLLTHFAINKPLVSCYEHNERMRSSAIIARIVAGESCALVTDAGTPAVSDPGELLVAACYEAGVRVVPLPGACAAICALSACGLPTGRFCFEGFLAVNKRDRRERLNSLKNEVRTMIFYEAPHKLAGTLRDLYAAFGDRRITLCRELTKIYEEFVRLSLAEAVERYCAPDAKIKGEFVLVLEGAHAEEAEADVADLDLTQDIRAVVRDAKKAGISRNEAYRAKLEAKKAAQRAEADL
ncbi:MAG: 16S rRNA (cytidine(1402)-2'-O)-methyltransferase [Clostridia bacterium]|nr:16S rRNA (cytidine(1402)-2'-O)-methyltransferase [Clostridia bacterium]